MSELDELKKEAVERIYLAPDRDEGRLCYLWCEDPAPGDGMREDEAVEYIRADVAERQLTAERERADALAGQLDRPRVRILGDLLKQGIDPESIETSLAQRDARVAADVLAKLYDATKDAGAVTITRGTLLDEAMRHKRIADEIASGGGHE